MIIEIIKLKESRVYQQKINNQRPSPYLTSRIAKGFTELWNRFFNRESTSNLRLLPIFNYFLGMIHDFMNFFIIRSKIDYEIIVTP